MAVTDLSDAIHAAYPHLIEDAIAFIKLPKRCKADLHDMAPGHRGGCPWCAVVKRQARAERGAL